MATQAAVLHRPGGGPAGDGKALPRSLWADADCYVEIWLEKDALSGVIAPVTYLYDVPLMVARGYASLSFLHSAAEQIRELGKPPYIYHLGDFDPSGVDAGRNIERRLREFAGDEVEIYFDRLAVTPEQIVEWHLPSRPTKTTDSRSRSFGLTGSVELDAIPPADLRSLVEEAILQRLPTEQLKGFAGSRGIRKAIANHLGTGGGGMSATLIDRRKVRGLLVAQELIDQAEVSLDFEVIMEVLCMTEHTVQAFEPLVLTNGFFEEGHFEYDPWMQAVLAFIVHNSNDEPVDVAAVALSRPSRFGTRLHQAVLLDESYLREEVCHMFRNPLEWLQHEGRGICVLGPVLYARSDVLSWANAQRRTSTSDQGETTL